MHPDDLELAYELLPVEEQAWHPGLSEARQAEAKRVTRVHAAGRARRNGVARPQCHGCRTFLKAHNAHCTRCGFDNAAGAYREGSSRYADSIPF